MQHLGKNGGLPGRGSISGIGRHGRSGKQFKRKNGLELVIDWKLRVCRGESGRIKEGVEDDFWFLAWSSCVGGCVCPWAGEEEGEVVPEGRPEGRGFKGQRDLATDGE